MKDNQHKDFDKFFQDKLNDRPFEFKDDFWEEMETLLPKNGTDSGAAGSSRKRLVLGILLLCLIGFTGWLVYPKTDYLTSNAKSNSNLNLNLQDFSGNIETFNSTENAIKKGKTGKEEFLSNNENSNENSNAASITENDLKNGGKSLDFNINKNKSPSSNSNEQNVDNEFIIKKKGSKSNIGKGENNIENIVANGNSPRILGTNGNSNGNADFNIQKDQLTAPILPIIFEEKENSTVNNIKNNAGNSLNEIGKKDAAIIQLLSTKPIALETENPKKAIQGYGLSCNSCPLKPTFHSLKIGLSTGLTVSQGFKNAVEFRAKSSFDPTVGLQLTYRHSPISDWSINTEVLYWSRSSLNAQIGYDSIAYGFGMTTISRTINIEELHYIAVPIHAVYTKKNHQFMGGLTVNYLLNAKSTTQGTVETLNYDAMELATEATTQQWGYTRAFNRIDVGLSLGYDYQVTKGWKVGTRINYGLTDVAKNDIFSRQSFDNNLNIRLLLTCDLKELAF